MDISSRGGFCSPFCGKVFASRALRAFRAAAEIKPQEGTEK
jgi:hypothetical protein